MDNSELRLITWAIIMLFSDITRGHFPLTYDSKLLKYMFMDPLKQEILIFHLQNLNVKLISVDNVPD